jgi:hypothetical protein
MTWVIGASSVFGYGAMMSDVRVRFSDGRKRDLLQKAYPVGPYMSLASRARSESAFRCLRASRNS